MAVLGALVVAARGLATHAALVLTGVPDAAVGSAGLFRQLVDQSPNPVIVISFETIIYSNPAADEMYGGHMVGTSALDHVHPDDRDEVTFRLRSGMAGNESRPHLELRVAAVDGDFRWVDTYGSVVAWDGRTALHIVLVDITERKEREAALAKAQQDLAGSARRFEAVVATLNEGIVIFDPDGSVAEANEAACELLSLSLEELRTVGPRAIDDIELAEEDGSPIESSSWPQVAALRDGSVVTDVVVSYRRGSGPRRWLALTTRVLPGAFEDDGGEAGDGGCVLAISDVTTIQETATTLSQLARFDQLTGLPNRRLCLERLTSSVARVRRSGTPTLGVFFVDLDNFKDVNDTLGHAAGDELLVAVADRLRSAVRPGDLISRFGGDEFVLIADQVNGVPGAEALADRLAQAVRPLVQLGHHAVSVTVSIGIALARPDEDAGMLLAQADTALYRAKARGRSRHELFDESMRARARRRLELEGDLRRAINHRALTVVYQPQVHVGSGRVVGVEALVRWDHPLLGDLAPEEFVSLAEDTGLVGELGRLVLGESLSDARAWREEGIAIPVGVNVSARQLDDPGLVASVAESLVMFGADASWLGIEITESALNEPSAAALETLMGLRKLGVSLSMDDFGTGSSSLAALRQLPVDAVKLDRRFQDGIEHDPAARAVVAAVTQLVHALGLTAVAEGVERADQLAALAELGCDVAQGYFLAHPMPGGQIPAFVRSRVGATVG